MNSSSLFTELELTFCKELHANHSDAVATLDATSGAIAGWAVDFYETEPALAKPLAEQPNLSDDSVCSVAFTLLFGETVERLRCARLLLFTGHVSRAISCVRDSLEALQWAHVTRIVPTQARGWMKGNAVKVPKSLTLPPYVSTQLRDESSQLLNVQGTHPYSESVYLSLFSASAGQTAPVQQNMLYFVALNFGRVVATTGLVAAYCLDQFPKLQTPEALAIISAVEVINASLSGIGMNLRDPLLSGYQSSF